MYTLESDTNFFDYFRDISSGEKRIVRVGRKTFEKTGTYITLKLYKKTDKEVFKLCQAVTLTTKEFDCLADNYAKKSLKKMVKAPTGEKISTSTTGNDKPQKRQYKTKRSVYSEKDCNSENGDDDEEDYSNEKCRVA